VKKLMLLVAFGLGYLLGARAGHERYDQIMGMLLRVRDDPRVQQKAHQAVDLAKQQAPVVKDKVGAAASSAASTAASKMPGANHTAEGGSHMAGPQGDLP
jgi:hypothetical protein